MPGVCSTKKLPGWLHAFPARWVVRGENNRLGYVRRSCSVGLMDGGSIPPGSTIQAAETTISDRRHPPVPGQAAPLGRRYTARQWWTTSLLQLGGVAVAIAVLCVIGAVHRHLS